MSILKNLVLLFIGVIALAACAPVVTRSALTGTSWELDRVWKAGKIEPPFHGGEWVRFTSAEIIEADDGCNSIKIIIAPNSYSTAMTAVACIVMRDQTGETIYWGDEFAKALFAFGNDRFPLELREGELWLYYSQDNALIFNPKSIQDNGKNTR